MVLSTGILWKVLDITGICLYSTSGKISSAGKCEGNLKKYRRKLDSFYLSAL